MTPVHGARRVFVFPFVVAFAATIGFGALGVDLASAQVYPPPTNTPVATPTSTPRVTQTPKLNNCARTGKHRKPNKFVATNEFSPGDNIVVKGKAKCAKANAKVTIKLDDRKIGSGEAAKNGAYTITGKIPKSTSFGSHTITVVTGKRRYSAQIEVVPSSGSSSSGFATAGPILAAWVALAGVIAAFFVGTRRRRQLIPAVVTPEADVPFFDTSHFVPSNTQRKRRRSKAKPGAKKPAAKRKAAPKKKSVAAKKKTKPSAKQAPKAKSKPSARKAVRPRATAPRSATKGSATTRRTGPKAPTTKPAQRRNSRPKGNGRPGKK
jgi:hypothetical protein